MLGTSAGGGDYVMQDFLSTEPDLEKHGVLGVSILDLSPGLSTQDAESGT